MKLLHIVGARPNFPKLAPVFRAAQRFGAKQVIVHTGQHYDRALSADFYEALELSEPDINLAVGSDTHARQTAKLLQGLEPILVRECPDWTVLYGDVNSTLAGALVASKLGCRSAHVEAGLRSFDRTMPEEINRIVTDRITDLLLTPSLDASEQLAREGESPAKIVFVGNVMVDSIWHALVAQGFDPKAPCRQLSDGTVLVTLHRPSNVDSPTRLAAIVSALQEIAREYEVIFPAHPRTRARLVQYSVSTDGLTMMEPLGYRQMLMAMMKAHCVITDSGGVQEETTSLGVPCLTLRPNTERPITITEGTNCLVPEPVNLIGAVRSATRSPMPRRPEGWDGNAGERIVSALAERFKR